MKPLKRKRVTMTLDVTVPRAMSLAAARREVRTLIRDQCNYSADPGDIRVQKVTATSIRDDVHTALRSHR